MTGQNGDRQMAPWTEGAWMTKHAGTYYLQYSAPGTQFKTYADGVYTSTNPMGPFVYAPYSPFSHKPTGFIGGAGSHAYSAAKAAVISLTQNVAAELAPHRIRVNAVAPGHIVTPRLYDTPQRADLYANSLLPVRQRGVPDDIGKAALFLASDMARYITGTTLDVDGGLLAANLFPGGLPGHNAG